MKQKLASIHLILAVTTLVCGSMAQAQSFLTNGLVAYYPLDGNVNDASGNGNNAVGLNTANSVDRFGTANKSLAFNGTTSQLSVNNTLVNLGHDYSISLWFKFNNVSLLNQSLVFSPGRSGGIGINYNDAPTVPKAINWSVGPVGPGWAASYIHGDKTNYVSGQWYQMIFLKNQHDYKMYIDGKLESAATVAADYDFNRGFDFGFLESSPSYLTGNLDEIRVYNRALPANEVQSLFELERGPSLDIARAVRLVSTGTYVGTNYQLQSTLALTNWVDVGAPFAATSTTSTNYVDVGDYNIFWRLKQVP